jgi:RND family efflux transporter MFP subunit
MRRIGVIALLLMAGCAPAAQEGEEAAQPPIAAVLGQAAFTELPQTFEAGGVLQPELTATISSRIVSEVMEVRVRAGDRVSKGQTLVVLDARQVGAERDRAKAALAAAGESSRAAKADEQAAGAALALARATHARIAALQASGSATPQELDDATAALRAAEARDAGARARVAEVAAALEATRAAAESATVAESYSRLAAPFAGVIAERLVDPGVVAAPGTPLLILEDPRAFHLAVRLDEARAARVVRGQTADVHLDGDEGGEWRAGRVVEIARVDPARHAFQVKVELPADAVLRSGLFGRARFAHGSRRALTVPAAALIERGQLTFVFVADAEGRARLRPVAIGRAADDRREVLAGLADGDLVVIAPPPSLADGAPLAAERRP